MLEQLFIRNLAIIETVSVDFHSGLQILSGETGSGKSILVKGLSFVLGAKASTDWIRAGESEFEVSATFRVFNAATREWLTQNGYELDEDQILLRRTFHESGKSKIWLNQRPIPLHFLQTLSSQLIQVTSQHASQVLLDKHMPRIFLDQFANHQDLQDTYREAYQNYHRVLASLTDLKAQRQEAQEKEDFYRFQFQEIEQAELRPQEEETLVQEKNRLSHFTKLKEALENSYQQLEGSNLSALNQLSKAEQALLKVNGVDANLDQKREALTSLRYELEDLAQFFGGYLDRTPHDPARFEEVENRLAELSKIKKKYGGSIEAAIAYGQKLETQLALIENDQEQLQTLQREQDHWVNLLRERARQLSLSRQKAASELSKILQKILQELALSKAHFEVKVEAQENFEKFEPQGADEVLFLFSANPGENLKNLAQVASGGELSRIQLALRSLLSQESSIDTYFFDEVDTGISGLAAAKVGEALKKIAGSAQVICITHLPQIAACGSHHFQISKQEENGRIKSQIKLLQPFERETEIARMIAGEKLTEESILQARALLKEFR